MKEKQITVILDTPEKIKLVEDLKIKSGAPDFRGLLSKAFAIYEAYLDGFLVEKEK